MHIIKTNTGASWAFKQIKQLVLMGVQVVVMLPEETGGFAEEYKKIDVDVIKYDPSLPVKMPWKLFKMIKEFKSIISNIKPDLIHCHFVTNIMFTRIALRNISIPRLFQVPGPLHLENIIYRYSEILLSDKNDYWAGSCKKTCEIYISSGIKSNRVFFGYYAGDFDQYAKKAQRTGILRKEFSIPDERFLIGTVSYFYKPKYHMLQFDGLKGHEDFIKAFSILLKDTPNVTAIIIGGPAPKSEKYMERIKKMAYKKCGNNIIFTGFRNDVIDIYPDLDLVVHPSRSENYGGCGESLSLKVPTLTTDVGGFPDFIKEGITGYMVEAANPEMLSLKMKYVIENYEEAKRASEIGQQFIIGINSKISAQQALDIYKEILCK